MFSNLDPAEAAHLGFSPLQAGVARAIEMRSPLIRMLASKLGGGSAYKFNRELALPAVAPLPINGRYVQGSMKTTPVTVDYKFYGGEAPIDTRLAALNGTINNVRQLTSLGQAKNLAYLIESILINGDSAADANDFDGLLKLIPATQTIEVDGPITIDVLNRAANLMKVRAARTFVVVPPDVEVAYRNLLGPYASAAEKMSLILGENALTIRNMPVVMSDYLLKNETTSAGANTGYSVLIVGTDTEDGATIILPPQSDLAMRVIYLGRVPGKPADSSAVEAGLTLVLHSELTAVRLSKVTV